MMDLDLNDNEDFRFWQTKGAELEWLVKSAPYDTGLSDHLWKLAVGMSRIAAEQYIGETYDHQEQPE